MAINGLELAGRNILVQMLQELLQPSFLGNGLPNLPGVGLLPPGVMEGRQVPQGVPGIPTPFVLLTNMFDPTGKDETQDPMFFSDLKEDVTEEGSKFGAVLDAKIHMHSPGHVFLRFDAAEGASRAAASLHGRWFAGKQVSAQYVDAEVFSRA